MSNYSRLIINPEELKLVPPILIGANLYGLASCLAFFKLFFLFELHSRLGPILFCIRHVMWDVTTVFGSYLIAVLSFGVGLVAIFGVYEDSQIEHFSDFSNTFKTLFWVIFDPGKEEYADINKLINTTHYDSHNQKAAMVLSHKIGIVIWAAYQVLFLQDKE